MAVAEVEGRMAAVGALVVVEAKVAACGDEEAEVVKNTAEAGVVGRPMTPRMGVEMAMTAILPERAMTRAMAV